MFLAVTIFKFYHYYIIDRDPPAIVATLQREFLPVQEELREIRRDRRLARIPEECE